MGVRGFLFVSFPMIVALASPLVPVGSAHESEVCIDELDFAMPALGEATCSFTLECPTSLCSWMISLHIEGTGYVAASDNTGSDCNGLNECNHYPHQFQLHGGVHYYKCRSVSSSMVSVALGVFLICDATAI